MSLLLLFSSPFKGRLGGVSDWQSHLYCLCSTLPARVLRYFVAQSNQKLSPAFDFNILYLLALFSHYVKLRSSRDTKLAHTKLKICTKAGKRGFVISSLSRDPEKDKTDLSWIVNSLKCPFRLVGLCLRLSGSSIANYRLPDKILQFFYLCSLRSTEKN